MKYRMHMDHQTGAYQIIADFAPEDGVGVPSAIAAQFWGEHRNVMANAAFMALESETGGNAGVLDSAPDEELADK